MESYSAFVAYMHIDLDQVANFVALEVAEDQEGVAANTTTTQSMSTTNLLASSYEIE